MRGMALGRRDVCVVMRHTARLNEPWGASQHPC
jgi:hypothetical protein